MKIDPRTEDLSPYKKWGMTLLQMMGGLAFIGVVGTLVLHYIFY